MWLYEDKIFESEDIGNAIGFVYEILDKSNGKLYIGKKNFFSVRRKPPLKGKKRKRIIRTESDWKDYYGSNEKLKLLVEEVGKEQFERRILRLCYTKGELSYFEAKLQFERDVLLSDEYYNDYIYCRVNSSHLKGLTKG